MLTREIVGHELNEPFDVLVDTELRRWTEADGHQPQGRVYRRALAHRSGWGDSGDLAALRAFQGDPGGVATDAS